MISDQTSSKSPSDRISFTLASPDNYPPSINATSLSLPSLNATSSSQHYPPKLSRPIITDCSDARGAASSDQPDLVDENDIVVA